MQHSPHILNMKVHYGVPQDPVICPCSHPYESSPSHLRSISITIRWKVIKIYNVLEAGSFPIAKQVKTVPLHCAWQTPLKWHRYLCVFLYFSTVHCPKCSVTTLFQTRVTNLQSFSLLSASGDFNLLLTNIISQTLSAPASRQLLHVSKMFSSPYFDYAAIVSCHKNMAILCAALVLLWPSSTFYFNIH